MPSHPPPPPPPVACRAVNQAFPPQTLADLPHSHEAPGIARHLVAGFLDQWATPVTARESILLIVSELVTNALTHARPPMWLSLHRYDAYLRGEVVDRGPVRPLIPASPDLLAQRGRGLAIVDALACKWGVDSLGDHKAVWFLCAMDDR